MSTKQDTKPKKKLELHVAPDATDPALRPERIAHTRAIQEALIARVKGCTSESELGNLRLEMEALPLSSFHHLAKMNVWDAMREKLGEFNP
jgi:hypothetical protein